MQNSSNQDLHVRKPTVRKGTHYAQETTFPWHTRMCQCASSTVVLPVVCHASLYFRMNTHQQRKNMPNTLLSVLFKPLCTLKLKPRDAPKWSNCAQFHALCTGNKVLLTKKCPECAQLSLLYWSVHEICAERFLLHYSVAFCSPYINRRCNFRTCLQNSSHKDSHVSKATVPKVTHYAQKTTFPWHISLNCPECAMIRLVHYGPLHVT